MPISKTKRPVTKAGLPRKRKGVKLTPTEMKAKDLPVAQPDQEIEELISEIKGDGGEVLSVYREPLGGHVQLFAALPVEMVEPTPYQRDVSDSHVRKLTMAMDKTRRFLDPIIVVRLEGKYFTPNGNHRLTALKELGAKTILALIVPEARVGYQILALNIEKAHNLREKSLEVIRMYEELAVIDGSALESTYALEFEEPQFITLGLAYEQKGRFSGGAYQAVLKRVDAFFDKPMLEALELRHKRCQALMELDDAVSDAVARLKEHGLESPYLKAFVVARINPLRFIKGQPPECEELLATMTGRARKMDAGKITVSDLSRSGGAPDEA
jgi:ParB family chromosome partitioning protein